MSKSGISLVQQYPKPPQISLYCPDYWAKVTHPYGQFVPPPIQFQTLDFKIHANGRGRLLFAEKVVIGKTKE